MFEVKKEIYTCQKKLNKLKQSLKVNNKLTRTVADTRVQMDVIWRYFKGTDVKLHEAKSKTHSIKLFHSPLTSQISIFLLMKTAENCGFGIGPSSGRELLLLGKNTRFEVLNWISLQKKKLQAKNSMISETIKCRK